MQIHIIKHEYCTLHPAPLSLEIPTPDLKLCNYMNYGDCKLETSNYNSPDFVITICKASIINQ